MWVPDMLTGSTYKVEFEGGPHDGDVWTIDDLFNVAAQVHKQADGWYQYRYERAPGRRWFQWIPLILSSNG